VKKRLKTAEALLKKNDLKDFYAALTQAVLGYAGDRYDLEAGAMTKEQLRKRLAAANVGSEILDGLTQILEQCEIARFSPGLLSLKDPGEMYEKTKNLLNRL
ncbi:MAG: hypothetical protein QME74_00060, partial [Candidatus Edwardsbacteria bacterium]|nr:hypothetical protein [Candidatus Edwardsbacteria bacterium]